MEYPNKNLQNVMQAEAHRIQRDAALFGDATPTFNVDSPFSGKFTFKRYGGAVVGMFNRHS